MIAGDCITDPDTYTLVQFTFREIEILRSRPWISYFFKTSQ
jgi:hypothetical protein